MVIQKLNIEDIDFSSERNMRYLSSSVQILDNLMDSIGKVGLINPVIVKKLENGNKLYTIVCGYQRIWAFKELGIAKIDAKIVDGVTDEELLLMSFYDNLYSRGFNDLEKATVLKKFREIGYTNKRLLLEILPLLAIPQNEKILDKYLSLLRLGGEVIDSLVKQELEIEKAFLLIPLEKDECDSVYTVLCKESKMNVNEAKETLRNLLDLKQIKQCGIPELLQLREIKTILQESNTNKRQKGESIYRLIKSIRYPTITKKENEFARSVKELALDSNVRINHSRFFEKDEIQITIKVSDVESLGDYLNKLQTHVRTGCFKKFFPEYS